MASIEFGLESLHPRDVKAFSFGLASAAALGLAVKLLATPPPAIIKAPERESRSAGNEKEDSLYPTDYYPGARDVETPYGSMRIYTFGPESGARILFVHGITTPSPVFTGILQEMAEAGYRVTAFDLFGRGYSDSPDVRHDDRLYVAQILCVLQTVGWTRCAAMVGYSLGGCLTSSFASYFPASVDKLILIAPAGLLVRKDLPLMRRIAINEHVPLALIDSLKSLVVPKPREIAEKVAGGRVDVSHVTQWQASNHKGFPRSCTSIKPFPP